MPHWIKSWEVPSSDGKRVYKVSLSENGIWGCSCPSWTKQRNKLGTCKHIKAIQIIQNLQKEDHKLVKYMKEKEESCKPKTTTRKIII